MGREFKIVTLQYFPYINYTHQMETKSPRLQLQDSLDYRILTEVAQQFNITYVYGIIVIQLKVMNNC